MLQRKQWYGGNSLEYLTYLIEQISEMSDEFIRLYRSPPDNGLLFEFENCLSNKRKNSAGGADEITYFLFRMHK